MPHPLYKLLQMLDQHHLWYRIDRYRPDTIMVTVTVVGERVEIDVFDDGHVEFSRFTGDESVESGQDAIEKLLAQFAAKDEEWSRKPIPPHTEVATPQDSLE